MLNAWEAVISFHSEILCMLWFFVSSDQCYVFRICSEKIYCLNNSWRCQKVCIFIIFFIFNHHVNRVHPKKKKIATFSILTKILSEFLINVILCEILKNMHNLWLFYVYVQAVMNFRKHALNEMKDNFRIITTGQSFCIVYINDFWLNFLF